MGRELLVLGRVPQLLTDRAELRPTRRIIRPFEFEARTRSDEQNRPD